MSTTSLGEVSCVNPRKTEVAPDQNVSFVGMAELDATTAVATPLETRPFASVSNGYTIFRDGDILAAKITPCWENGKVGQAQLEYPVGVGSTEFHVIRPGSSLDRRYLLHFLRHPHVRATGELRMTGSAGQRRVPAAFINDLRIPLPPLEEQRRIAAILDHADALRAKRRQVIAHLDSLTQSIFHNMFGAIDEMSRLTELVEEFRYGTSNKSGSTGDPTLRIPNVVSGSLSLNEIKTVEVSIAERDRLLLRRGDLLFVRSNGNPDYVGRCAVFDPDHVAHAGYSPDSWIYASYLIRARLHSGTVPAFVSSYLASPGGRKQLRANGKTSAGQFNINIKGLESIRVPLVPESRQRTFTERVSRTTEARSIVQRALDSDDQLFASLQARAFRGEL